MTFKNKLQTAMSLKANHLCLGIDPPFEIFSKNGGQSQLPQFFADSISRETPIQWLQSYCETLLEAAKDIVPAVKPQSAYFEAFGPEGFRVLQSLLSKAKSQGLITILDAKRGDIAATMKAYGSMAYEAMGADALTVTAYMGLDVLEPLTEWLAKDRGAYVVWISSNPSGEGIQHLVARYLLEQLKIFQDTAEVDGALGLVFGATKFDQINRWDPQILRTFNLLMPGVGAQGGHVTPSMTDFLKNHSTALIPQSRSLGSLHCRPEEREPTSWDDFGLLVEKRVQKAAAEIQS